MLISKIIYVIEFWFSQLNIFDFRIELFANFRTIVRQIFVTGNDQHTTFETFLAKCFRTRWSGSSYDVSKKLGSSWKLKIMKRFQKW